MKIIKIRARKLNPSENMTRGERVRATGGGRQVTIAWDYGLREEEMYDAAARAVAAKLGHPEASLRESGETIRAGYVFELMTQD